MIIHWPGMMPGEFSHSTSHLDLSVTLLQDMLGVSSTLMITAVVEIYLMKAAVVGS